MTQIRGTPKKQPLAAFALLFALILLLFAQWVPHDFQTFRGDDSGIFLSVSQAMLRGAPLYTGAWDHKPPLIFCINALGLALGGGSAGGVLAISLLAVCVFFVGLWLFLWRRCGPFASTVAVLMALVVFPLLASTPNFTEVYALPFQLAAFALAIRALERGASPGILVAQGALFAVLFNLRPNLAGAAVLGAGFALAAAWRAAGPVRVLAHAGIGSAAAAICEAVILLPFLARGALSDYWFATVGFNLLYSDVHGLGTKLLAVYDGIVDTSVAGLSLVALAAALASFLQETDKPHFFARAAAAFLFLEMLLAGISGNSYPHYFLLWLLPMAALVAITAAESARAFGQPAPRALGAALIAMLGLFSAGSSLLGLRQSIKAQDPESAIVARVASESSGPILVWGDGMRDLLFRLQRPSAGRFVSGISMGHSPEIYRLIGGEMLASAANMKPEVIVEFGSENIPPLFSAGPPDWDTAAMKASKQALRQAYAVDFADPALKITVYRKRDRPGRP